MAISFVAAGTVVTGANPTVTVPAGIATGDVLLISLVSQSGTTVTTPTGWTQIGSTVGSAFYVFYRYAQSTQGSVALTSNFAGTKAVMVAYRGTGAYQIVPAGTTGTGTSATPNAVTTTYANDYIVSFYGSANNVTSTWTANASTTARVNNGSTNLSTNGLLIADELQAGVGASTPRAATLSTTNGWYALAVGFIPARTVYWVGGNGTWDASTTTNWADTSGGAGGKVAPSGGDAVIVNGSSGSPTITLSSTPVCASLTTTGATCTLTSTGTLTVWGNVTLSTTTTWSATGLLTLNVASTITAGSTTFACSISGASNVTLGANLTLNSTSTFTFTAGTLTLSTFTLSTGLFSSTTGTRVFAFGTGRITTTGSGSAFNVSGSSLTYTGTPTVNISNNSATATTVTASNFSATNAFDFNITTGTYTITISNGGGFRSLNFTGFTGTWSPSTATATFYGNLTLVSGMTFTTGSGAWTFANTSGNATITSAGKTLGPISQSGSGGTVVLADNLTSNATFAFTGGTLNLNNNTFSCNTVNSLSGTRAIQFGTGNITVTGSGTSFNLNGTGFSYTGTPTINISNNSATALTIPAPTGYTATNALNYNITVGTYALTVTSGAVFRALNFTGFTGSWAPGTATATFYGGLTLVSGMTFTTGSGVFTFANTSGTATITSAGKTLGPITQNGVGGTVALGDNIVVSGAFTYTNGTLNLANNTLQTTQFSSSNTNTRVIQFGTGNIRTSGSGTAFSVTGTNLTYTGTPTVNISNSGATATTVTASNFSATNAFDFNITTGTYAITLSTGNVFKSLNFTGFTGTWSPSTATATFYGDLTLVSGMTFTTGTGTWTFANTSGTANLLSAGKTLYAVTMSGAGGTLAIDDVTTLSNALTFTAGTLQLPASLTTTVDSFVTTGTTLKYLTSSIPGTQANISDASGTNTVTYLSITDNNATGGAVWDNSAVTNVLGTNVTGWTNSSLSGSSNFFLLF